MLHRGLAAGCDRTRSRRSVQNGDKKIWLTAVDILLQLEPILIGYDQAVDKRPNESDPLGPLYHALRVFLIDREGRIRNITAPAHSILVLSLLM
jgi:hypothetical protein